LIQVACCAAARQYGVTVCATNGIRRIRATVNRGFSSLFTEL
jgi:hypothetical protein